MSLVSYVITTFCRSIASVSKRFAARAPKQLKMKIHEQLYVEKLKQEREALKSGHPVTITRFAIDSDKKADIHTLTSSLLKNELGHSFVELKLNQRTGRFEPEVDADGCFSVHTYKRSGVSFARLGIMIHGFRVVDSPADIKANDCTKESKEDAEAELLN